MSQTIQTRYRDIPFEEAVKCYLNRAEHIKPSIWNSTYRGKPIAIQTPPIEKPTQMSCNGPFYDTGLRVDGWRVILCPHVAEIGD